MITTGKAKIEAAFSTKGAEEIPVVIPYEGIYYRDHWDEVTGCPWWYMYDTNIEHELEWRRNAALNTGQDWFRIPFSYTTQQRKDIVIEQKEDKILRINKKTNHVEVLTKPLPGGWDPNGGAHSVHPQNPPMTLDELNSKIGTPPYENREAYGGYELARLILSDFGKNLMPLYHVGSPLWLCYGIWGFETMMTLLADNPSLIDHACKLFLAHQKFSISLAAELGAKIIWIEECMTDMISPVMFERYNTPYVSALVDEINKYGMKSIYYYCGNPQDKWDLIISTGADSFAFEESKKNFKIDIKEVASRMPENAVIFGNLDAINVLENEDDKLLKNAIKEQQQARLIAKKRFIMSLGSPVTAKTSVQRVQKFIQLSRIPQNT